MKKIKLILPFLLSTIAATSLITFQSNASVLLSWDEGNGVGFGNLAMQPNDDGSSGEIKFVDQIGLAFDTGVNFFGTNYQSFYINNNGNITFNSPVSNFTPQPFPISQQPMIAPFWADVDTTCATCGEVYVGSPNQDTLVVTWDEVGFYDSQPVPSNSFQLVMIDRTDTGAGNFDVEFRYEDLNWTTGEASGGDANGLGGTPAQAGYDAGDGSNFFALPGSFTANVLDLQNTSNTGINGIWSYSFREGELPGNTPTNPVLPIIDLSNPTEYRFELNITEPDQQIFIDPDVAIGYDYIINSTTGPLFASVLLPLGFDDNLFDLFTWDNMTNDWIDSNFDLTGGVEFDFIAMLGSALERFRILGIDTANMVDPTNTLAFVTGITFDSLGQVSMNQNAISQFVPGGMPVPEPPLVALMLGSFLLIFRLRSKQK